eukprot:m.332757 g.332757  ORF g.332757 m.332757 type:complete len:87 (+) comp16061_c1_seq8:296-556(+)
MASEHVVLTITSAALLLLLIVLVQCLRIDTTMQEASDAGVTDWHVYSVFQLMCALLVIFSGFSTRFRYNQLQRKMIQQIQAQTQPA